MPRLFSIEHGDGSPIKYVNSVGKAIPISTNSWVDYGTTTSKAEEKRCTVEFTNGKILTNGTAMREQVSCTPHAYNAGNLYNGPAQFVSTVKSFVNSICPRGWTLQPDQKDAILPYTSIYGINHNASSHPNTDAALLNLPLSLLHSGSYHYDGSLLGRDNGGVYILSSFNLNFNSGGLIINTVSIDLSYDGFSLRCFLGRWEIFDNRGGEVSKRARSFRKGFGDLQQKKA